MSDDVVQTPVAITHQAMVPVDPPGIAGRRWRCVDCGQMAPMKELARTVCDAKTVATT